MGKRGGGRGEAGGRKQGKRGAGEREERERGRREEGKQGERRKSGKWGPRRDEGGGRREEEVRQTGGWKGQSDKRNVRRGRVKGERVELPVSGYRGALRRLASFSPLWFRSMDTGNSGHVTMQGVVGRGCTERWP